MLAETASIAEIQDGETGFAPWSGKAPGMGAPQRLQPGQQLFEEGDAADDIFEIRSGTIRLCKLLPDGRRQIIGFITAGRLLGFDHHRSYAYTAEAVTVVTLHRHPRDSFEQLLDQLPGLARRLLTAATEELRAAQDQMLLLGRKTATERIATFLLSMVAGNDDAGVETDEVHVPMGRGDIADYLGLTIETVSRSLAKLKQDRLIGIPTPSRITLLDRDRLEDLATGLSA